MPTEYPIYTRDDAEQDGYELRVKGQRGEAFKGGKEVLVVVSATPMFGLLNQIAALEGRPFTEMHGGHLPVTPELVKQVSGEKYKEPPAPEVVLTPAEELADIMLDPEIDQEAKNAALAAFLRGV